MTVHSNGSKQRFLFNIKTIPVSAVTPSFRCIPRGVLLLPRLARVSSVYNERQSFVNPIRRIRGLLHQPRPQDTALLFP